MFLESEIIQGKSSELMADASLLALSGLSTPFMPLCRTALGASVWPSEFGLSGSPRVWVGTYSLTI